MEYEHYIYLDDFFANEHTIRALYFTSIHGFLRKSLVQMNRDVESDLRDGGEGIADSG